MLTPDRLVLREESSAARRDRAFMFDEAFVVFARDLPNFNKTYLSHSCSFRSCVFAKGPICRALPNFVYPGRDFGVHGDFNPRILEMHRTARAARSLVSTPRALSGPSLVLCRRNFPRFFHFLFFFFFSLSKEGKEGKLCDAQCRGFLSERKTKGNQIDDFYVALRESMCKNGYIF